MRKETDYLQQLISSLSKHEKSYIISQLSPNKNKNHFLLFNVISKQKEYNNKELEAQLNIKNISVRKNRLFAKLLQILNVYQENHNDKAVLNRKMSELAILRNKGMFHKMWLEIKKLEKEIIEKEYFSLMIKLLEEKTNCINLLSHKDLFQKQIKLQEQYYFYTNKSNRQYQMFTNANRTNMVVKSYLPSDETGLKYLSQIIASSVMLEFEKFSFIEKSLYFDIMQNYHLFIGDLKPYKDYAVKNYTHWQTDKDKQNTNAVNYIIMLSHLQKACAYTSSWHKDIEIELEKLSKIHHQLHRFINIRKKLNKLTYLLVTEKYKTIQQLNIDYDIFSANDLIIIQIKLAISFFHLGNYLKAKKQLNNILNADFRHILFFEFETAHLLFILCIIKQEMNSDYIDNQIDNSIRWMKKQDAIKMSSILRAIKRWYLASAGKKEKIAKDILEKTKELKNLIITLELNLEATFNC